MRAFSFTLIKRVSRTTHRMHRLSKFASVQDSFQRDCQPYSLVITQKPPLSCQPSNSASGMTFDKVMNGELVCHHEINHQQERRAANFFSRHCIFWLPSWNLKGSKSSICHSRQWEKHSMLAKGKLLFPAARYHLAHNRRSSSFFGRASPLNFAPFSRLVSTFQQRPSWNRKYSTHTISNSTSSNDNERSPTAALAEPKKNEAFSLAGTPEGAPETEFELDMRIHRMFDKADTNSDGWISREEFHIWYKNVCRSVANSSFVPPQDLVEHPTKAQLDAYSWRVMLPFVAFGFIDNFLMIMCGECIDICLSQKFACSMMISAGLGNAFSDAVGVLASDTIDRVTGRVDDAMGAAIATPMMTEKQLKLNVVRRRKTIFQTVGIVAGCIIGMFPLIFI